jgi:hypothetical protein
MFLQPTNGFDRGVPGVLCWTEAAAEARMLDLAPDDLIATEADLRERFAAPGRLATLKQLDWLDHNCRRTASPTTRRAAMPPDSCRCSTSARC